ncbi:MAG: HAMP domain-containing sensor histidine kinase [Verrucomicrobiota bacterium]
MISASAPAKPGLMSFRLKLLAAMMLVVSVITALGLYIAQRQLTADVEHDLKREFKGEVASLSRIQEMHRAALGELCRALARKPRIHAALEDNALDLLYPNAKDELRDMMELKDEASDEPAASALHATFYRFLNGRGAVITPPNATDVGELRPEEVSQLTLSTVPTQQQIGYLLRGVDGGRETIDEVIAMPIISTETQQPIAAIAVGFKPVELGRHRMVANIKSGIWVNGGLHLPSLSESSRAMFDRELTRVMVPPDRVERSFRVQLDGVPHLLFYKRLNPNSLFPPAYEICIYPLNDLLIRQRQLRWQILGAGAILLLGAFVASQFASARLSAPVEKLAEDSAENRAHWEHAEAELEKTSKELQRSARFSANTSHQLKTPVSVLRAGLEALRSHENLTPDGREEIAALIHQTFRITSIIEDLLLLSQMDAGRLQIAFTSVDLSHLLEAQMDDLSALPDGVNAEVESDCPELHIAGEKHYVALILQNLLENARKYNRPGGRIRISCREDGDWAVLTVGNTGRSIPASAQEHIFERFHRGGVGEDITGHGLGLNLARELARLHGGDLRLVRSDEDWTEFEVRFRLARQTAKTAARVS